MRLNMFWQNWMTALSNAFSLRWQQWCMKPLRYWGRIQLRAMAISWHKLTCDPVSSALTLAMLMLTLLLPAGFSLAEKNVQHLTQHWREGTAITAYLQNQTSPEQAQLMAQQLMRRADVRLVQVRTPQQQHHALRRVTGLPLRAYLPKKTWPYALRIYPNLSDNALQRIQTLLARLRTTAGIELLQVNHGNIARTLKLMTFSEWALWLASLIAAALMAMKVLYTIRAQMLRHRDEILLLSELGARRTFIRREYQYMGLMLTATAAIIVSVVITLGTAVLRAKVGHFIYYLNTTTHLWLLLGSCLLGWLGARMASLKPLTY